MKSLKYYLMALAGIAMLNACSDDLASSMRHPN